MLGMMMIAGRGGAAQAEATGPVPASPTGAALTPGDDQLAATWDAPLFLFDGAAISSDPVTSYTVRWGLTEASVEDGGTPAGSQSVSAPTTNYTITGLAHATTYYVSVSAHNAAGESLVSQWVSWTTT